MGEWHATLFHFPLSNLKYTTQLLVTGHIKLQADCAGGSVSWLEPVTLISGRDTGLKSTTQITVGIMHHDRSRAYIGHGELYQESMIRNAVAYTAVPAATPASNTKL